MRKKSKNSRSFRPRNYLCPKCGDIIRSTYPGEYVECKCGAIGVDQDEYTIRLVGKAPNHIDLGIHQKKGAINEYFSNLYLRCVRLFSSNKRNRTG